MDARLSSYKSTGLLGLPQFSNHAWEINVTFLAHKRLQQDLSGHKKYVQTVILAHLCDFR